MYRAELRKREQAEEERDRLAEDIRRSLASLDDPNVTWIAAREILVEALSSLSEQKGNG